MNSRNRAKVVLAVAVLVFVTGVAGLSFLGGDFFKTLEPEARTVAQIDLARQNTIKKEYKEADEHYKQAIADAEKSGDRDATAYALASYAEFLRKRKRPLEAAPLEDRARRLQGIIK